MLARRHDVDPIERLLAQNLGVGRSDPQPPGWAVLEAYALFHHESGAHHGQGGSPNHGGDIAGLLHRGERVARAQQHLSEFMRDLLAEAAKAGVVRADVAPDELASYCLHTLTAASGLPSKAAVRRLVTLTMAGLQARA